MKHSLDLAKQQKQVMHMLAGSFIYTAPYFTELSLLDRFTAVSLIKALLEYDTSEQTYLQYDAMTAKQLFSSVSPTLYRCSTDVHIPI